jgi:hypothetical protein
MKALHIRCRELETVMVRLAELAVALAPVSMVLPRALAPP